MAQSRSKAGLDYPGEEVNVTEADMSSIIRQEKHIMLVLNELCHQISTVPPGQPFEEIDLLSVAQKLQENGLSVKQTHRCWEIFRKKLRDVQKRESDFVTACRQRLSKSDTLFESTPQDFKARISVFDRFFSGAASPQLVGSESNDQPVVPETLKKFGECESLV